MKTLDQLPKLSLKCVFTDIDGTLTTDGRIGAEAYSALWTLHNSGIAVVPVTGRPAGWCEMIARTWPVHGVIGENGAFYFRFADGKMQRHFVIEETERLKFQQQLKSIENQILTEVVGSALASDQFTRMFDLAIDFCEDVPALEASDIDRIVEIFKSHGAVAKVSNIHVNGWFGSYDKLTTCRVYCEKELGGSFDSLKESVAFAGDSPNDEPMFDAFPLSFAVKNIEEFLDRIQHPPQYVSSLPEGEGFSEIVTHLIKNTN